MHLSDAQRRWGRECVCELPGPRILLRSLELLTHASSLRAGSHVSKRAGISRGFRWNQGAAVKGLALGPVWNVLCLHRCRLQGRGARNISSSTVRGQEAPHARRTDPARRNLWPLVQARRAGAQYKDPPPPLPLQFPAITVCARTNRACPQPSVKTRSCRHPAHQLIC